MKVRVWIYCRLGNTFFKLNGGLAGLKKKNLLYQLTFWAWAKSWYLEEKAAGRMP